MKPLLVLLIVVMQPARAAFEPCAQGARSAGLGGAMVACAGDAWASFCNPAMLAAVMWRAVSLTYCPELYGLHEITRASFSYVEPTSVGSFALSGTRFGFALYRELGVALSYGTVVGRTVYIGGSLGYDHLGIRRYGGDWTPVLDLGAGIGLGDRLCWGMAFHNVAGGTIGAAAEKLPEILSTGLSGRPFAGATINAELFKDVRYPAELHAGVEYLLLDILSLRGGIATEPVCYSAGAGVHVGFVQLDYALTSHPLLGITQQISVSFQPVEF